MITTSVTTDAGTLRGLTIPCTQSADPSDSDWRKSSSSPLTGSLFDLPHRNDMPCSDKQPPAAPKAECRLGKADGNAQRQCQPPVIARSLGALSKPCPLSLPAFLEPVPVLANHFINADSVFRPHFFTFLKEKYRGSLHRRGIGSHSERPKQQHRRWPLFSHKISLLQKPVPRRSSQLPFHSMSPVAIDTADPTKALVHESDMPPKPVSPTMAAASASAVASAPHLSGSTVTETLMSRLRKASRPSNLSTPPPCSPSSSSSTNDTSSNSSSEDEVITDEQQEPNNAKLTHVHHQKVENQQQKSISPPLTPLVTQKVPGTGINHTMFLTKNAHIKRPRNAWIHFRCHYGQALKSKDPTLRAEAISKCASQRWARLTEKEKKPWHDLAEQEKQAHKEAFPEYRYCPKRHSSTSIASTASSASTTSSASSCSTPSPTSVTAPSTGRRAIASGDMHAEHQPGGDTGAETYKKARRRTK